MKVDFIIKDSESLQNWCKKNCPHIRYEMLQQAIRKGDIKINGYRPDIKSILYKGDIISIWDKIIQDTKHQVKIIYENDDFLVIDKPYGISTQGGIGIKVSLIDIVQDLIGRAYIVHRLDKYTSGIIVIAKSAIAAYHLSDTIHSWEKKYLTKLELGDIAQSGSISLPVDGKKAITKFRVLAIEDNYILVEFQPLTGRMHQIRQHAAYKLTPIMGDKRYGSIFNTKIYLRCVSLNIIFKDQVYEFTVNE